MFLHLNNVSQNNSLKLNCATSQKTFPQKKLLRRMFIASCRTLECKGFISSLKEKYVDCQCQVDKQYTKEYSFHPFALFPNKAISIWCFPCENRLTHHLLQIHHSEILQEKFLTLQSHKITLKCVFLKQMFFSFQILLVTFSGYFHKHDVAET